MGHEGLRNLKGVYDNHIWGVTTLRCYAGPLSAELLTQDVDRRCCYRG